MTDAILQWMKAKGQPVLISQAQELFGPDVPAAFSLLSRNGHIRAVFPEAKRGDSGRQFWELAE